MLILWDPGIPLSGYALRDSDESALKHIRKSQSYLPSREFGRYLEVHHKGIDKEIGHMYLEAIKQMWLERHRCLKEDWVKIGKQEFSQSFSHSS